RHRPFPTSLGERLKNSCDMCTLPSLGLEPGGVRNCQRYLASVRFVVQCATNDKISSVWPFINICVRAGEHHDSCTFTSRRPNGDRRDGNVAVRYGDTFDEKSLKRLPPGSVYSEPGGGNHFARTSADPVLVQITGIGPTDTRYVNPA